MTSRAVPQATVVPAPASPVLARITTNPASRILEADDAALALLGGEAAYVVGRPLASFVEIWDRREFRDRLTGLLTIGAVRDWRFRIRTGQGRTVQVVATATAVPADRGAGARVSWTLAEDLESRHVARHPVANVGGLDEAMTELRHEISQPLAAILAFAHGCLRRLHSDVLIRAELESALESIVAEAKRAGDLVRSPTPEEESDS